VGFMAPRRPRSIGGECVERWGRGSTCREGLHTSFAVPDSSFSLWWGSRQSSTVEVAVDEDDAPGARCAQRAACPGGEGTTEQRSSGQCRAGIVLATIIFLSTLSAAAASFAPEGPGQTPAGWRLKASFQPPPRAVSQAVRNPDK